jgi:hypothetical protein
MGRPIKKKWFSARDGSVEGDLQVTTAAGAEVIEKQTGTGVYTVASGSVQLQDGGALDPAAPGVRGGATLQFDNGVDGPQYVRKLNQFRVYYFDSAINGGSDEWNDGSGNLTGTFTPPLSGETPVVPVTATGTATMTAGGGVDESTVTSVTITDGGAGYTVAPTVTFSAGDGTVPATATGTAVLTGDAVTSVTITDGGQYADATTATVTFSAP